MITMLTLMQPDSGLKCLPILVPRRVATALKKQDKFGCILLLEIHAAGETDFFWWEKGSFVANLLVLPSDLFTGRKRWSIEDPYTKFVEFMTQVIANPNSSSPSGAPAALSCAIEAWDKPIRQLLDRANAYCYDGSGNKELCSLSPFASSMVSVKSIYDTCHFMER